MRVVCPHCLSVNNVPEKESYKKANCGKCKKSLLDTKPIELTNSNFDEVVVNSDIPVIVDFWAPWCGPCKMFSPTFKNVAKEFPLKAQFIKVNTEILPSVAARFAIRSIPSILFFKDGDLVDTIIGAQPKSVFADK